MHRQCQKSLNEVKHLIESNPNGLSPQGLYLEVYKLVSDNNKIIARDFDDWRRSTVSLVLAGWLINGVLKKGILTFVNGDKRKNDGILQRQDKVF